MRRRIGVAAAAAFLVLGAGLTFGAGQGPNNSEQVVFSGDAEGTLNGTESEVDFWIHCEDESNNRNAGQCMGAVSFEDIHLVRAVKGTVIELPGGEYQMSVFSTRDDSVACTLTNVGDPPLKGPNNVVNVTCTTPAFSGESDGAVVKVTGPPED